MAYLPNLLYVSYDEKKEVKKKIASIVKFICDMDMNRKQKK